MNLAEARLVILLVLTSCFVEDHEARVIGTITS